MYMYYQSYAQYTIPPPPKVGGLPRVSTRFSPVVGNDERADAGWEVMVIHVVFTSNWCLNARKLEYSCSWVYILSTVVLLVVNTGHAV